MLPGDLIRRIFRELLLALDAAHQAGLIHRDVKSSNILLDGQGLRESGIQGLGAAGSAAAAMAPLNPSIPHSLNPSVKLADFGLARMRSAQTRVTLDGSVLGTPEYMSPEQARGEGDIDHRTDLYSAGVVLYEMLTGQTPFHCETATATIRRILDEEPPDPRKLDKRIDPALASLALRLMAKRPDDRFASASEALAALDRGHRVSSRRGRRRAYRRFLGVAITLAVVILLVWFARHPTGQAKRQPAPTPVHITRIEAAPAEGDIRVWYADDTEPRRLLWLRELGYRGRITGAAAVATLSDGRQVIAVGCEEPLDDAGSTVVAFDVSARELWRWAPKPEWEWPDVPAARYWVPLHLATGDIDGAPGDEFVFSANHPDLYPARLSPLDAATGVVQSTLWHFGHLDRVVILDKYFDDHRAAILAWGQNNKLDGFDDGLLPGETRFASWDIVCAAMIVHPDQMAGLAPPPVGAQRAADHGWFGLEPAPICAYAFLDRAIEDKDAHVPKADPHTLVWDWRETVPGAFCAGIDAIRTRVSLPGAHLAALLSIPQQDADRVYAATLQLDSHLELLDIAEPPTAARAKLGTDKAFWDKYWQVIMRDGEYVEK